MTAKWGDTKVVRVEQTLHGYDAGHSLLASSVSLSPESARTLLILSDLSGPRPYTGFESYLTCYPLVGSSYYVFARTWMAGPAARPGSVWTHSLLVDARDLARVNSAWDIVSLHQNPESRTSDKADGSAVFEHDLTTVHVDEYSRDLHATLNLEENTFAGLDSPDRVSARQRFSNDLALSAVTALYEESDRAVVVPSTKAEDCEELFLRIWEQQWPALRASFAFCTGALAARRIAGKRFDIVAAPSQVARQVAQESDAAMLVSGATGVRGGLIRAHWPDVVCSDLGATGPITTFRRLLWQFAETPNRAYVAPFAVLAEVMDRAQNGAASFQAIADVVSALYPDSARGTVLKRALLGPTGSPWVSRPPDSVVLLSLANASNAKAFDADELAIKRRATELWRWERPERVERFARQLRDAPHSLIREAAFVGLTEGVPSAYAVRLDQLWPGALYHVVRSRPGLAEEATLWKAGPDAVRQLLAALNSCNGASLNAIAIVRASVQAGANAAAPYLAQLFGPALALRALWDALPSDTRSLEIGAWSDVLRTASSDLTAFLSVNQPPSIVFSCSAGVLYPSDIDLSRNTAQWQWLGEHLESVPSPLSSIRAACLLFAAALTSEAEGAAALATSTFPAVHAAAAEGRLSDDAWVVLEPVLPQLGPSESWDRCERLRRALYLAFRDKRSWSIDLLLTMKSDVSVFERLFAHLIAEKDRHTLERISKAAQNLATTDVDLRNRAKHALKIVASRDVWSRLVDLW